MKLLYYSLAVYLSLCSPVNASGRRDSSEKPPPKPCTITSPTTGRLFDLRELSIPRPDTATSKNPRTYSWNATGYDIGYNFTLNFCAPVVEPVDNFVGIEEEYGRNVSAYYKSHGKFYSLGFQNSEPVMRGKKLVLNYTNGSPCEPAKTRAVGPRSASGRAILDDDDDDDNDVPHKSPSSPSSGRRKNTIISMLCEKDPLAPLLQLSFIGSPDECTYIFEGRSAAACPSAAKKPEAVGPAGVFGIIALIAVLVYLVGGCVYSRVVLQQRGWRQLPNYALWAGMFGFFRDIFIILTSSCTRFLPARRGYSRVNGSISGGSNGGIGGLGSRGRNHSDSDAENRLIDELNEEWED